jgi:hypothetical protein
MNAWRLHWARAPRDGLRWGDHGDTAFYYPGIIWHDARWIKSLTLFFEQIRTLSCDPTRSPPP